MKRHLSLFLAAASLMSGAHAATTYNVDSNITGAQLWVGDANIIAAAPGGYFSDLRIAGTAIDTDDDGAIDIAQLTMTGTIVGYASGLGLKQTFDLQDSRYIAGSGVVFEGGIILNEAKSDEAGVPDWESAEDNFYPAYDPFLMLKGLPGHYSAIYNSPPQQTAGLLLAPGTTALPGLWDGVAGGAGYDSAAVVYQQFGVNLGLYLQGTMTVAAVPLPAGAWLFASGLIGLAGAGRKRRRRL